MPESHRTSEDENIFNVFIHAIGYLILQIYCSNMNIICQQNSEKLQTTVIIKQFLFINIVKFINSAMFAVHYFTTVPYFNSFVR